MLIIVVLLFGICWFPLQLYNILHVTWSDINEYKYINIVWFCSDWLAMSNSCYNPFIYGIYNVNINLYAMNKLWPFALSLSLSLFSSKHQIDMHENFLMISLFFLLSFSNRKSSSVNFVVGFLYFVGNSNTLMLTRRTSRCIHVPVQFVQITQQRPPRQNS